MDAGYRISTAHGDVLADRIVITIGAWLPNWLNAQLMPLQVLRKHLHWFESSDARVLQSQAVRCSSSRIQWAAFMVFRQSTSTGV